jgi:hypothetical protein
MLKAFGPEARWIIPVDAAANRRSELCYPASVTHRPTRGKRGHQCGWSDLTTRPRLFLNGQPGNDGFRKFEKLSLCLTDVAIVGHNDEHCFFRRDQHEQ